MEINDKDLGLEIIERANKILKSKKIQLPDGQAARIIEEVTEACLEQFIWAAKKLASENGGEATIAFRQLLDINISNRVSEDGEKDGNLMISFVPGPQAKLLAKQDDLSEGEED